ncbi:MAG: winged helix DNA-binding domain-containing protein [Acidimicrobiia bacterium]|nr:winged helix DNA-binding domain-containing protein [Acidimicrobiia bacterium]
MRLTPRSLNRATLDRQMLLERASLPVVEGVRRAVALQAQEPASPHVALWNRLASFDPDDLNSAFERGSVVKAPLMRITLHAVDADDYPSFHSAMTSTLRAARLNDRRFKEADLPVEEMDALVAEVIEFARVPRTSAEIETMITGHLESEPHQRVFWAMRTFAPLLRTPTGGPWSFTREILYGTAPVTEAASEVSTSVQHLLRRYLEGFGPASAQDFAQFALLRMSSIRPALDAMSDELVEFEGPNGKTYYDLSAATVPDEGTIAPPRLLGMWDSILLGYADRSRTIPEEYRSTVIRRNGDVLPTVLVDGLVAGVWRAAEVGIEVKAFDELSKETWTGLEVEARSLHGMLAERDPNAFGRHGHWWTDIPASSSRVLV